MHASTFAHGTRVSVSVVFFFLESPMALASYGRRTATGSPSVIVNSMLLFGRAGAQTPPRLISFEGLLFGVWERGNF